MEAVSGQWNGLMNMSRFGSLLAAVSRQILWQATLNPRWPDGVHLRPGSRAHAILISTLRIKALFLIRPSAETGLVTAVRGGLPVHPQIVLQRRVIARARHTSRPTRLISEKHIGRSRACSTLGKSRYSQHLHPLFCQAPRHQAP